MNLHMWRASIIAAALWLAGLPQATAAEIKVRTAGAFKVAVPADLIVSGETELGLSTTIYTDGLGGSAKNKDAIEALIKAFAGPAVAAMLKSKGMEPAI